MESKTQNQVWKFIILIIPLFVFFFSQLELGAAENFEGKSVVTFKKRARPIPSGKEKTLREETRKAEAVAAIPNKSRMKAPLDKEFGKLIVTYHTDPDSIDPDIVRFRLINPNGVVTTHPDYEGDAVAKLDSGRVVMVQQVPSGEYTLEFFIDFAGDRVSLQKQKVFLEPNKTQFIRSTIASSFTVSEDKRPTEELTKKIPSLQ